jgi:hypothetical protein
VIAINLYRDTSGFFVVATSDAEEAPAQPTPAPAASATAASAEPVDDEDDLLYGDVDISAITSSWQETKPTLVAETVKEEPGETPQKEVKPTFWAVVIRASGHLEVGTPPS